MYISTKLTGSLQVVVEIFMLLVWEARTRSAAVRVHFGYRFVPEHGSGHVESKPVGQVPARLR